MSNWKPNRVPGIGPVPCDIMLIGEAPGREENYKRVPFIGKTGKELNGLYLPLAGLERDKIRIDNVIQFQPPSNRTPTDKEIEDSDILDRVEQVNPKWIIAAGATANKVFRDDADLEKIHGRAYKYENKSRHIKCTVIPVHHPASGFRDGTRMHWCIEDFNRVRQYIFEGRKLPIEPTRTGEWGIVERASQLIGILEGATAIGIDTEDCKSGPWSLQIATCKQAGWFIHADNRPVINDVFNWMYQTSPLLYLHHAIHDLHVMEQLRFDTNKFKGEIFDTMVKAKQLGTLPIGLKSLAYRLLNEEMDSYSEVVQPAMNRIALKYLEKAAAYSFPDLPRQQVWRKKNKKDDWDTLNYSQPQNLTRRLQRVLWEYGGFPKNYIQDKVDDYRKKLIRKHFKMRSVRRDDIDRLWKEMPTELTRDALESIYKIERKYSGDASINLHKRFSDMKNTEQCIEMFGDMPTAYLEDIEFDKAVEYACQDALNTFRIGEILYERKANKQT